MRSSGKRRRLCNSPVTAEEPQNPKSLQAALSAYRNLISVMFRRFAWPSSRWVGFMGIVYRLMEKSQGLGVLMESHDN